jgi:hypothetical protein
MRRLCSDSSCSYPGRSAQRGDVLPVNLINQVRPLVEQAWAYRLAAGRCERIRQQVTGKDIARKGEIFDVIGQKSAKAIVVKCPG